MQRQLFLQEGLFCEEKPNKRTKLTSNKNAAAVHRVIVPVGVKKSVKTQATTAVKFSKYRGRRKVGFFSSLFISGSSANCSGFSSDSKSI